MDRESLTSRQKALTINLDKTIYGSFAEIGAGQEVARYFFLAGAASGTVAKTISAYDMAMSDALYGKSPSGRFVCEERLEQMLDIEYHQLITILPGLKKDQVRYFVFADTVAALNYKKDNESHGWMGVRFQLQTNSGPNEVVIHVKMLENDNILQQRTLGILGVNLIYGCFNCYDNPSIFLQSLMDGLSNDRIEIDMIRMKGPEFQYVDNRLLAVQLVQYGMTQITMFNRKGEVKQPANLLYKKNVLVLRGSFRPITYVSFDMLKAGFAMFKKDEDYDRDNTLILCEITLNQLVDKGEFKARDFLDRADILCGMGQNVMISNFREYYKLASYLSEFKIIKMRFLLGIPSLLHILDESYYKDLKGGILEAFGRLFVNNLKLYVYPTIDKDTGELISSKDINLPGSLKNLYQFLRDNRRMIDILNVKKEWLLFFPHDVLLKIWNRDDEWEKMVPKYVSKTIKSRKLFGYGSD